MPVFVWSNVREVLVPVGIGIAVFLLGAWPDLLGRERGFSVFRLRLPAWMGVDFWYLAAARGSRSLLFASRRLYAPIKDTLVRWAREGATLAVGTVRDVLYPALTRRPVELLAKAGGEAYGQARERLWPVIREYQGDLAVGALAIAVSLALFLIIRLL
jgi:hypothetical protein